MSKKLVDIKGLSAELGPSARTFRTLVHNRKIPFIKAGHRTMLFEPEKVREALSRFEVKAIGSK